MACPMMNAPRRKMMTQLAQVLNAAATDKTPQRASIANANSDVAGIGMASENHQAAVQRNIPSVRIPTGVTPSNGGARSDTTKSSGPNQSPTSFMSVSGFARTTLLHFPRRGSTSQCVLQRGEAALAGCQKFTEGRAFLVWRRGGQALGRGLEVQTGNRLDYRGFPCSGARRRVSGVFGHDATAASTLQKMAPAATSRGVAEDGGAWATLASPSPTAAEPTNDYLSVTPRGTPRPHRQSDERGAGFPRNVVPVSRRRNRLSGHAKPNGCDSPHSAGCRTR